MQGSGWSRPGSQSCDNNGCFLLQEAERWTISIQPQSSKLSFQQACRGRRSSCTCCGLCSTHRASVYLPLLFGSLTSLGMSPRGQDSGRVLSRLSEPNRTTLLLQGWTVGSAHAPGGNPHTLSQVRVQCTNWCLRSAQSNWKANDHTQNEKNV